MDPDKKVKQIVADAAKEMGADIKLKAFVCFRLGEGLEKRNEDFAAEVASAEEVSSYLLNTPDFRGVFLCFLDGTKINIRPLLVDRKICSLING